jgi:D-threo-aldose 1-dehydrogenase
MTQRSTQWLHQVAAPHIGFGGAPLGNLFSALDEDAAQATLTRAWARGLRYFDTAPHYGNGLSEHRIGRFLRTQARGDFLLSTKVGRLLVADSSAARDQNSYCGVLPFVQRYDYSHDGALRSLEDSLQRMGLARVDIAYVHDIDVRTHGADQPQRYREAMQGALPALARLRSEGVVDAIGLGVNEWEVCRDALRDADVDLLLLAGRYTLLDQSALAEMLPVCAERGTRVVIGGPYNSGILATGAIPGARYDYADASAAIVERVRQIEVVCVEHGVPLRAAALQFPAAHPVVASVIPGARSASEVDDGVDMMNVRIPIAFWRTLVARGLLPRRAPLPG